jgi:hypothetical protein
MSALAEHLARLEAWLRRDAGAPAWTAIRLVESDAIKYGVRDQIPRSKLFSVADYEPRFEQHLAAGHSWLNLSALGVLDTILLVCVERPRVPVGAFGHTSVNLSGPRLDVRTGRPSWDASAFVDLATG